jgi:histidinol-phosphatase
MGDIDDSEVRRQRTEHRAALVAEAGVDVAAELALALQLADIADAHTMHHYRRQDLVVEAKADRTEVTIADQGAEDLIVAGLVAQRPGHAVLGEERGEQGLVGSRLRWVIDPVDGTANFVRGVPVWATLIALQLDGHSVVGVASCPALGLRWWAGAGLGSFRWHSPTDHTETRSTVSKVSQLGDAFVTFSDGHWNETSRAGLQDLLDVAGRQRGFGDFWMHMLVAEGAVDVAVEPIVSLWDLAAVQIIVEEAGGCFTNLNGEPRADGGSACSTNGFLHRDVLARVGGPGPHHR